MKGIVFTEFLEMVEEKFGLETVDFIINESKLESNGVYTSVGTYDFIEMQSLIVQLSKKINIPVDDLVYAYGLYFYKTLVDNHKDIFDHYKDPMVFVASVEDHIHVEVRKLYPGAELPSFGIIHKDDDYMEVVYTSERGMYMFAKALMEKTFEYYDKNVQVEFEKLKENGTSVKFMISTIDGGKRMD